MNRLSANILTIAAILIFCAPSALAEEHHAHHQQQERKQERETPQLNHGKLWATDAPLRQGMERIRDAALLAQKASINNGKLSNETAATLASGIDDALAFMFERCALESGADENLHILLERLIHASEALKENHNSVEGMPQVHEVLKTYPHYFEHPNWETTSLDGLYGLPRYP